MTEHLSYRPVLVDLFVQRIVTGGLKVPEIGRNESAFSSLFFLLFWSGFFL
jgi:hypothetical protein